MQEVAQTASTIEVINKFNDAFNRHDSGDALMWTASLKLSPPDGERFGMEEAVCHFGKSFSFIVPDAVFQSMRYRMKIAALRPLEARLDKFDRSWHVRGVDVLRVRDGKVAGFRLRQGWRRGTTGGYDSLKF
jgi:hypothetical protein